jgi:hypothetical protein
MTRFFFDQSSFESRGKLYFISLREEVISCDSNQVGSCFYKVIALFKKRHSPN